MLNGVESNISMAYTSSYNKKSTVNKTDIGFEIANSDDEYSCIMKLYDEICQKYPDVTFRLDDKQTSIAYQKKYGTDCMAYLGYGNSMNQVGDNFGEFSQKSVEIDVSVLKNCIGSEDYKDRFMSKLDMSLREYSSWQKTALEQNASYMCMGFTDDGNGTSTYAVCANTPFSTENQIRQMYNNKGLAYSKQFIIHKVEELQSELTETYMNMLSEHNRSLYNKLINSKNAVEQVSPDKEIPNDKLKNIGMTSEVL